MCEPFRVQICTPRCVHSLGCKFAPKMCPPLRVQICTPRCVNPLGCKFVPPRCVHPFGCKFAPQDVCTLKGVNLHLWENLTRGCISFLRKWWILWSCQHDENLLATLIAPPWPGRKNVYLTFFSQFSVAQWEILFRLYSINYKNFWLKKIRALNNLPRVRV